MKTLFNDILAILLTVVFSTAMISSQSYFLFSPDISDMYAAAVNAEGYKTISPLDNGQPLFF
jgi:hypothetical protein